MSDTLLRGNKALITAGAMVAGLMAFLDISIVNVALNDIRANFGTPLDQIVWVSTAYAMANITIIPISGWLLKRFGFRRYYTASILIFTAASVLCGLSWNLVSLVVFRILQGLGGGAIIPTSQSVLFGRYPEKEQGTAGALFAIGAITGPLLGPTVGGYLVDWSSWHWIFFLNLPLGIFAAFVAWTQIEQPGFEPNHARVDKLGIALLAIGMTSLQYVLEEGNRDGWFESTRIVVLAAVAAIALIGFISHELETENPVVDLRVFADRGYSAATGLNFLVGTAIFAGSVLLSLYCGTIMHYKPLDIGRIFLQGAWIQLLIFPIVGKIVSKVDPRLLMVVANAGITLSLYLSGQLTNTVDPHGIVLPYFVRCIGTGFGFVPLTFLAVASLPADKRYRAFQSHARARRLDRHRADQHDAGSREQAGLHVDHEPRRRAESSAAAARDARRRRAPRGPHWQSVAASRVQSLLHAAGGCVSRGEPPPASAAAATRPASNIGVRFLFAGATSTGAATAVTRAPPLRLRARRRGARRRASSRAWRARA